MIVRRFMGWLRLTLAGSLSGTRRQTIDRNVRESVLVGASSQRDSLEQSLPALSLSSWLDNGRRLRPRLRLTSMPRESGVTTTRPLRHKSQPASAAAEPSIPRISLAPVPVEPMDATPMVPAVYVGDEQGDDLSNLEQLDAETRRLMLLRHLVRRRVFNEGFAGNNIPKQYHRSLGLEPPREE